MGKPRTPQKEPLLNSKANISAMAVTASADQAMEVTEAMVVRTWATEVMVASEATVAQAMEAMVAMALVAKKNVFDEKCILNLGKRFWSQIIGKNGFVLLRSSLYMFANTIIFHI